MKRILLAGAAFAAMISLSACGGGGGVNSAGSVDRAGSGSGGTPTPVATPTPTPVVSEEMRYLNSTGGATNADYAFSSGWLGQGVTVGVIDDGVVANSDLKGQIDTAKSRDFGKNLATGEARGQLGDSQSDHGTQVASIIAARQDGSGTLGYAPKAKIAVLRITDVNADGSETYGAAHQISAIDHAIAQNLKILNRSLGSTGYPAFAVAMDRYAAAGGLMINSAGNDGSGEPSEVTNVTAANRASWLFVGALAPGTVELADYSVRAGSLADRYVVAPGTNIAAGVDGAATPFSGTSSAAPVVTALAADILSKWPQLSGQQAGDIILNTARDLGDPGVDAVFGHGLVDFRAALQPQNPTLSNGSVQTVAANSLLVVPQAIDPQVFQAALDQVTVLDGYGRDYSVSLAGMIVKPDGRDRYWLRRRMLSTGGGSAEFSVQGLSGRFSYANGPVRADGTRRSTPLSGKLAYRTGKTTYEMAVHEQDALLSDPSGMAAPTSAVLAYAAQASTRVGVEHDLSFARIGFSAAAGSEGPMSVRAVTATIERGGSTLRASIIDESGAVFGARSNGALTLGRGALTLVAEANQVVPIGHWALEGYASVGTTRLRIDRASLITGATSLVGTRFGLQLTGPAFGGMLNLGLAQPLTIESGRAHLTYGAGYDFATRSLLYRDIDLPLAGDRHFTLAGGYALDVPRGQLRLGMMHDMRDSSNRVIASLTLGLGR